MRRVMILAFATATCFAALLPMSGSAVAQQAAKSAPNTTAAPANVDVDRIIRAFAAKESRFRNALNYYGFRRDAVMQQIGMGGQIVGEYHRVSNFTFDNSGLRFEKISFFPMPSLASITPEDLEDLGGVNQFALEASQINLYNFTYVGKERIDELDLYVFDVAPKITPDAKKSKQRFFIGRIWVDDRDLQIVKTKGKGIPEDKNNKYPVVETYREQIDGKYWFPTWTGADDTLYFSSGSQRIRMLVRYENYKQFRSTVNITFGDEVPAQTPKP